MDRRKMKVAVLGLVSILVIEAFLLCSVPQAGAETLKARSVVVATKYETIPVNDEPGHILSMQILEGLALLDNGEITKNKVCSVNDTMPGKGSQAIVYATLVFQDGSTIVITINGCRQEWNLFCQGYR